MITFNSKILTIAAIGLMIYLGYLQRKESMPSNPNMQRDFEEAMGLNKSKNAMYKIEVPKNKKYEDYNPLERLIYNFSKSERKEW
ncbi:MAG: hypothetical protein MRQ09_03775 [Candidatus Midichloria sp.]|nr:hypothetical protein [Candidatus Midichloria sp.]